MIPNLSPPVDRSQLAQQGLTYRSNEQAFSGSVQASADPCAICLTACDVLPWPASAVCRAACNAVCK